MQKTCAQRIEEIQHINLYRAILKTIPLSGQSFTTLSLAIRATGGGFPDPSEYASRIEGLPARIAARAEKLGPNMGDDNGSMAASYEKGLKSDLESHLADLDKYWEGEASEAFTGTYMAQLGKHLQDLADACEAQKKVADRTEARILKAHDEVVGKVRGMVAEVVSAASWGAIGEAAGAGASGFAALRVGFTIAGSAATAGIGATVAACAAVVAILDILATYHSEIENAIDSLNTDLGVELTNALEGIERRDFKGRLDTYASKSGWRSPAGAP